MRLYIIGFMGSGKSYVGRELARLLKMDFIDLDTLIVNAADKSIPEIFNEHGEDYFRELEKECLQLTGTFENVIIATGGGTPCYFDNMDWINLHGWSLFLDVDTTILVKRLLEEQQNRPLLKDFSEKKLQIYINDKLRERRPFYEKTHIVYKLLDENIQVIEEIYKVFQHIVGH